MPPLFTSWLDAAFPEDKSPCSTICDSSWAPQSLRTVLETQTIFIELMGLILSPRPPCPHQLFQWLLKVKSNVQWPRGSWEMELVWTLSLFYSSSLAPIISIIILPRDHYTVAHLSWPLCMLFPLKWPFPISTPGMLLLSVQLKDPPLLEVFLTFFPLHVPVLKSYNTVLCRSSVFTSLRTHLG